MLNILLIGLAGLGALFLLSSNNNKAESFASSVTRRKRVNPASRYYSRNSLIPQYNYNLPPPPVYNYPNTTTTSSSSYTPPPIPPAAVATTINRRGGQFDTESTVAGLEDMSNTEWPVATPMPGRMTLAEKSQYYTFTPVTQADIAAYLAQNPIGLNGPPMYNYPGFIRRADGLMQWDGHTIPPVFDSMIEQANNPTDFASNPEIVAKGLVESYESSNLFAKWILYCLQNRPFAPGTDISATVGPPLGQQNNFLQSVRQMQLANASPEEIARVTQRDAERQALRVKNKQDIISDAMVPKPVLTIAEMAARKTIGGQRVEQTLQHIAERNAADDAALARNKARDAATGAYAEVYLAEYVG